MNAALTNQYENDTTPSRVVVERYRTAIHDEDSKASLALIHYRGGEEEFALGREYAASSDPADRATGADVLSQLGWSNGTFFEESVQILIPLLNDTDDFVVFSAAVALGHRGHEAAISPLVAILDHDNALVRYGVVHGLTGHDDIRAIQALITLASDQDRDVRDWAVFGIGSQTEADSPQIREALKKALFDPDQEIRGEALVGLALRGDIATVPALFHEWENDEVSLLSIEAAAEVGDPILLDQLRNFSEDLSIPEGSYFSTRLADAIAACEQKAGPPLS